MTRQTPPKVNDKQLPPPKWRRLAPVERRHSILKAARQAFIATGDMNSTTIRAIAQIAGTSEGLIYHHFNSKEQLFFEAVVEPLQQRVDKLIAASALVDRNEPLTPERQLQTLKVLYRQLIATFDEVLPLAWLVLASDQTRARSFYQESLIVAMDRLGAVWKEVQERYGPTPETSDVTARAIIGTALMLALEGQLNDRFDRERAIDVAAEGYLNGFFPKVKHRPRRE